MKTKIVRRNRVAVYVNRTPGIVQKLIEALGMALPLPGVVDLEKRSVAEALERWGDT